MRIIDTYQDIRLKTSIRKISPKIYNCLLLKQKKLVALMVKNSNQILIDMKNIYKFKDIIEISGNNMAIHLENIDNNP